MGYKKNVLITGGAGFIGTNVVLNLYKSFNLIIIDRLDFKISKKFSELIKNKEIEFIKSDLNNLKNINKYTKKKIDYIIHLASITHIPDCENDHLKCLDSNFRSLVSLLLSLKNKPSIINFSTSATYAKKNHKHKENQTDLDPIDLYGLSKLFTENYLRYLCRYNNFSVINIKLANAVGPGETNEKLFGTILKQIQNNKKIIKLGNLSPKRDYIHVNDISFVIEKLIQRNLFKESGLYNLNLGTGHKPISVRELFNKINKVMNNSLKIKKDFKKVRTKDKERELLALDVSKLKKLIPDYKPQKIDDWIKELVKKPNLRF